MRTALIVSLIITPIVIAIIIQIKARKHRKVYDSIMDEIPSGTLLSINTHRLDEYGFVIHDTKDRLYALHPNGVSMTHLEGAEWAVKITKGWEMWHDKYSIMSDLIAFCERHGKPIKKAEDGIVDNN